MKKFSETVVTVVNGVLAPLSNASVTVRNDGTGTLSTLYEDQSGLTPLLNPHTSSSTGLVEFYVPDGTYDITVQKAGYTDVVLGSYQLDDPSEGSGVVISGGAINNTPIGESVPSTGVFSTLQVTGGVGFPATQVPSADPNTLDDYEEGTFTPFVQGSVSSGSGTYSIQTGAYVKIGKLVTYSTEVAWSAHSGSGNLRVSGIPFIPALSPGVIRASCGAISMTYTGTLMAYTLGGSPFIGITQQSSGTAGTELPIATSGRLQITGHYYTS